MRPLWWSLSQSDFSFIRIENLNTQKMQGTHAWQSVKAKQEGTHLYARRASEEANSQGIFIAQSQALRKSPCWLSLWCSLCQPRPFIHPWLSHLTYWGGFPATLEGTQCHLGLKRCEVKVHGVHRMSSRVERKFQIFTTSISTRCWPSFPPKNMRLSCLAGTKAPA